jgi:hypothetical protein
MRCNEACTTDILDSGMLAIQATFFKCFCLVLLILAGLQFAGDPLSMEQGGKRISGSTIKEGFHWSLSHTTLQLLPWPNTNTYAADTCEVNNLLFAISIHGRCERCMCWSLYHLIHVICNACTWCVCVQMVGV